MPIFYKETIARRLLTFEHFRNLIETQQKPGHGITCYSDHLPGIKSSSLSNKGKLSTWRIHETSDLTSIVETLYKSGPTMAVTDPRTVKTSKTGTQVRQSRPTCASRDSFQRAPTLSEESDEPASQRRKRHCRSNTASTKLERTYQPN